MEVRRARLREFALGLPEAHEDFPWGGSVMKVRRKVFVFLEESYRIVAPKRLVAELDAR